MVEYFERDSMQLQLSEEQWDKFNDLFDTLRTKYIC
jgi:hypothetical protein